MARPPDCISVLTQRDPPLLRKSRKGRKKPLFEDELSEPLEAQIRKEVQKLGYVHFLDQRRSCFDREGRYSSKRRRPGKVGLLDRYESLTTAFRLFGQRVQVGVPNARNEDPEKRVERLRVQPLSGLVKELKVDLKQTRRQAEEMIEQLKADVTAIQAGQEKEERRG